MYFKVSIVEISTDCIEININSVLPEFLLLNNIPGGIESDLESERQRHPIAKL